MPSQRCFTAIFSSRLSFPHLKLPKLSPHSQPASPPIEMKSEASLASRAVLEVAGLDYVIHNDLTVSGGKQHNSEGEALHNFVMHFKGIFTLFFKT